MSPQFTIDTQHPVLVTGATGYVAGWVVQKLLEAGVTVHAAVRNPDAPDKVEHLLKLASTLPGSLKLFKADLLDEGSYESAMQGCRVVFHTASPFHLNVKDPQKDLVDPALLGTRNVLNSANRTASVQRVVLTSSCAAIYGDNADLQDAPNQTVDESCWNRSSSLDHQAYSYSKTVAEQEAWDIANKQDRWKLVVVNPSFVIGPGISANGTSESFNLFKQFGDGRMKAGVPDIGIGAVDVRDLADAHLRAAFVENAEGRHIISGHNTSFLEMANTLQPQYGKSFPIPRRTLPKWLVWLVGPLADKTITRQIVCRNAGYKWQGNNQKSREALGINYRPLAESTNDFFRQLVESGQLRAR